MRPDRQPVATHGNGFRLFEPFLRLSHLPPVATALLHKCSIRCRLSSQHAGATQADLDHFAVRPVDRSLQECRSCPRVTAPERVRFMYPSRTRALSTDSTTGVANHPSQNIPDPARAIPEHVPKTYPRGLAVGLGCEVTRVARRKTRACLPGRAAAPATFHGVRDAPVMKCPGKDRVRDDPTRLTLLGPGPRDGTASLVRWRRTA
jgi:hypothetical protein